MNGDPILAAFQATRVQSPDWSQRDPEPPLPDLVAQPARLPDPRQIPPRRWLMGTTAIREYISLLVAPGGVGKTTYAVTSCLAAATGKKLLGEHIFEPCGAWLFNLEDPLDEMDRRVAAAMIHHQIAPEDIEGRLFINSGRDRRLVMASFSSPHDGQGSRIVHPDKEALIREAKTKGVGLIVVDPFANSHELDENSNPHMNAAVRAWAEVAREANCAVFLVHHTRKGTAAGTAGDIEGARGGKALSDGARVGLTLAAMTVEEAGECGVPLGERWRHVRLDDGKANLAPRADRAKWFKLVGISLGNGDEMYPNGDNVQAMEPWTPPSAFGGATVAELNIVLDRIEQGPGGGSRYTANTRGRSTDRWVGQVLVEELDRTEEQAKTIVKEWLRNGLLVEEDYTDPEQRKVRKGLRVDFSKRPGTTYAG